MSKETEPKEIVLTTAQKNALTQRVSRLNMAKVEVDGFVGYLMEEHGIAQDGSWNISQDLSKFVKVEMPEPENPPQQ